MWSMATPNLLSRKPAMAGATEPPATYLPAQVSQGIGSGLGAVGGPRILCAGACMSGTARPCMAGGHCMSSRGGRVVPGPCLPRMPEGLVWPLSWQCGARALIIGPAAPGITLAAPVAPDDHLEASLSHSYTCITPVWPSSGDPIRSISWPAQGGDQG